VATAIKIPNPNKTGTPKGMEGVRPGSPKAVAAGFKPPKKIKPPKPSAGAAAAGTTIQTPPVTTTQTVTTSTPPTPEWWNSQMGAGVATNAATPVLGAEQSQIGSAYGVVLNRVTEGSDKGQPLFRLPNDVAGKGTIRQSGFDAKGNPVYKDAAGNVISDISNLVLDYTPLRAGQAGYLQGALGSAAATSANTQQTIGQNAALAGVRRSGMRAQGALAEAESAQNLNAALTSKAQGEYTTNLGKWAALYNQIYQGLVPQAEGLAAPITSTVEVPVATSAGSETTSQPSYLGYNLTSTPESGALSGGPEGAFMDVIRNVTLPRNTNDAAIRQGLRALLNNSAYKLTSRQKAYINSLITGRYKGNKKY